MFADADLTPQTAPSPQPGSRDAATADLRLPSRLRDRLTSSDRGAALIVLVHLLPVWWLVSGGGLYLDDLRAQAYARNQPFWSFIVSSNGTHLAPGARTLDWLQMQYAPLEHWPAVVVTLGTHLLLGIVTWTLLRELVGPRAVALVPLTVALLTPALVSATAWYRQTLTTLVPLVFVLAATYCAVRLVRGASQLWAVAASGLIAVALLFSERAIAGCALAVTMALVVPAPATPGRLRRLVTLVIPLLLIASAYIVIYRRGPFDQGSTRGLAAGDFVNLGWHSLGLGVVPALVGGPWKWAPSGPSLSVAATPTVAGLACTVALVVALAVTARRREARGRVLRALLVAAAYVVPVEAFVFVGRYAAFRSATGLDLRLFADCAVVLAICLGVAFLGWRDPAAALTETPRRHRGRRRLVTTVGAIAMVVAAAGAAVSWGGFGQRWHDTATPGYIAALRADLAQSYVFGANRTLTVLPGPVPDAVLPARLQTDISSLDLVALLDPKAEVALDAVNVQVVGPRGRLEPGQLRTLQRFDTGADNFCHYPVLPAAKAPTVIPSPKVVPYQRDELIELGILVGDERTVEVEVVGENGRSYPLTWPSPRTLLRGPYTARLRVPYGVDVAAVRAMPARAGMCVVSVKAVVPVEPQ